MIGAVWEAVATRSFLLRQPRITRLYLARSQMKLLMERPEGNTEQTEITESTERLFEKLPLIPLFPFVPYSLQVSFTRDCLE